MHIALVGPDLPGHLNPLTTLGRELLRRGHRITLFGLPPAESFARRAGLGYVRIGGEDFVAAIAPGLEKLSTLSGLAALKLTGKLLAIIEAVGLRELPAAFRTAGIDAVITDQISPCGATAAEINRLPFAIVCNALQLHQEAGVPPPVVGWKYRPGWLGRMRNQLGNRLLDFAARPIRRAVDDARIQHGLGRLNGGVRANIGLVQIAQQPAFFDFPRTQLLSHFHYTGPWHERERDADIPFPWDRLDGRPMVYASLGTLQNRLGTVFQAIVEACAPLDVQLVLSLGRKDAVWGGPTPANALIVPFAPQLKLLEKASAVVTHAGLNTALETLARGVPMVCLPVTNDQPGVASRVAWLGAGVTLSIHKANAELLRRTISTVLTEPAYRTAAMECRRKMAAAPGMSGAADLVEKAFSTGRRVERDS